MYSYLKKIYKDKTVLITGGAGFIGSNLIEALLDLNAKIVVFDDFSTGSLKNISSFLDKITLVTGSICDLELIKQIFKNTTFFAIFHLAAIPTVPLGEANPDLCREINILGMKNLLSIVNDYKSTTNFVFASSGSVYGTISDACTESIECSPKSYYAFSKLVGEKICENASKETAINCFALRFFNVYGKNEKVSSACAAFRDSLKNKKKVSIFGSGLQVRDFVPVQNVVLAMLVMPASGLKGFNIFNVGSGQATKIIELVHKIAKEEHIENPQIEYLPARKGDVDFSWANCEKLTNLLKKVFNNEF